MINNNLLPCPFCGAKSELNEHYFMGSKFMKVTCSTCGCDGPWGNETVWNTRIGDEVALHAQIATLRTQLAQARGHNGAGVNTGGPHPVHEWYGPCDANGVDGACSVCSEAVQASWTMLRRVVEAADEYLRKVKPLATTDESNARKRLSDLLREYYVGR